MEYLGKLMSPYIQELPLELAPVAIGKGLALVDVQQWHLLLDVMQQNVFVMDHRILREVLDQKGDLARRHSGYRRNCFIGIEVEINTNCNLRCNFCPVSSAPHPQKLMSLDQFRHVVSEAALYGIKEISLNHYSEPTLHPDLANFIAHAAGASLSVTLFTNGTNLSRTLVDRIAPLSRHIAVIVNIADSNAEMYQSITRRQLLSKVIHNVQYASKRLKLEVVINNGDDQAREKMETAVAGIPVSIWRTDDRAGLIDIPGISSQNHFGLLNGCPLAIRYVSVSVDGDVFLCPQDFRKINVMGNLYSDSLQAILNNNDRSWQFRRWVFGIDMAPDDWICRRCSWTTERGSPFSVGASLSEVDMHVYREILLCSLPTLVWMGHGRSRIKQCNSWDSILGDKCFQ